MKRPAAPLFTAVVHKDPADSRPTAPMLAAEVTFVAVLSILAALCLGLMIAAELLGGG